MPLSAIRVIDLADHRGEFAGRILADLGAEVIVIEPPQGSDSRRRPPFDNRPPLGGRQSNRSLYWQTLAHGKHSVVVDFDNPGDAAKLKALVLTADILIESSNPGDMAKVGLGYDDFERSHPALIYVSISPWGQTGPNAHLPATDLTIEAAGGLVGMQGDGDRPPIPVGFPQANLHAGVQAAADAITAIYARHITGRGQHLDVSMQAAMVWTLMNATGYPSAMGVDPPGFGAARGEPRPTQIPGVRMVRSVPCADGNIVIGLHLPGIGERTLQSCMGWMSTEHPELVDAELCNVDWTHWMSAVRAGELTVEVFNRAYAGITTAFEAHTKRQLLTLAVERKWLLAPILELPDLLSDPQLASRDYWQSLNGITLPGPFAKLSETPIVYRRPAPELGDAQRLLNQPHRPARSAEIKDNVRAFDATRTFDVTRAFDGLQVADFAWVGVGPMISKALADHGANVVHIESSQRFDVLRMLPPFKDGERGINRSQFFANFNTSKRSIELDFSNPVDLETAHKLVAWADVVVESFTPGTMAKYGLDYASIAKDRPDLVMLSTCMRGQTGPERSYSGFGNQGAALAGLFDITGWPDRPPCGPWGAYTDFIAPRFGTAALAAALLHRQQTGRGQFIDLSQIEAGIHFLGPLVADYQTNGQENLRTGFDSRHACPQGIYSTAGKERYLALSIDTDDHWRSLTKLVPNLPIRATLEERIAIKHQLNETIALWCRDQDAWHASERLTKIGVPAYPVLWPTDLYEDPQLAHRQFFVELEHPEMGRMLYDGHATQFSETPPRLDRPGPRLGEHTDEVMGWLGGMSTTTEPVARPPE
ncbi:MAG: CoA transferase [Gammaproteobacteria bacterium]|nr:CoA transferase [Gammaproteobacteria bacterium]